FLREAARVYARHGNRVRGLKPGQCIENDLFGLAYLPVVRSGRIDQKIDPGIVRARRRTCRESDSNDIWQEPVSHDGYSCSDSASRTPPVPELLRAAAAAATRPSTHNGRNNGKS